MKTRVSKMFGIEVPIIQAGMVWTSGRKLAVAVSEAGALGLIGSGSMKSDLLREHIRKAKAGTKKPFGVNIPLIRGDALDLVQATVEEGVKIVFTSSGHPGKFIDRLKKAECTVVHVVASVKHAKKAFESGCDAVVAEGFEAGGHNGIDEITTMCLVPQVVDAVPIPVIAAGGIAHGRQMFAAMALGAEGVQMGTRFAATVESSSHDRYKQAIVDAQDNSTLLTLRKVAPVRMIKTPFAQKAQEAEMRGQTKEELQQLLGSKREMQGIFEGNWEEGEFEAGQSSGLVHGIITAGEVVRQTMREFGETRSRFAG
ncbi:MAG TPA: nitronate monooxygenase [Bacteroidota bacterium]|nr:nitronate monooxygenase [Bacteroidota bacterium]